MSRKYQLESPDVSDRSWVSLLPDHAIYEIEAVKHDCLGGDLGKALSDEKWRRHATALTEWPVHSREIDGGNSLEFISFCGSLNHKTTIEEFRSRSPDDKNHRPARTLNGYIECSCGWREGFSNGAVKEWRYGPKFWWPTVTQWNEKDLDGLYYVVCRHANRKIEDPRHAPRGVHGDMITSCICGSFPYYKDLKLVPVEHI